MSLNIIENQRLAEECQQKKDSIRITFNIIQNQILTEECQQREDSFTSVNKQKNVYGSLIYDRQILENPADNSLFLKRLRPEVRLQFLGEQRKYKFLKKFAIKRVEETLRSQINIFFNLNHCHAKNCEPDAEITHGIFSWSLEEFEKRRLVNNFVWIDVMLKSSVLCIEKYKFRKDVEEFQRCVECLFKALLSNMDDDDATIDQTEQVVQHVSNIKQVLEYYNNMEKELQDNEKELKELDQIEMTVNQIKRDSDKRFTVLMLQLRISNNYIRSPIEIRCQLSWYRTSVQQRLMLAKIAEKTYSHNIIALKKKRILENAFDNNCMDFFYTTIDNLKSTIINVQSQFDEDAEKMENILNIKRARLDKLHENRKLFSKEIIRFHEEIEARRIIQEAEDAEKENLRLKKEEKALAAEQPKTNNKKANKKAKKNK